MNTTAGLEKKLKTARDLSRNAHGRRITFYVPGMVHFSGLAGRYQAVSITGGDCILNCDHCRGRLLKSMYWAPEPQKLVDVCVRLAAKGNHGVLISGGCDQNARLPWNRFLGAIAEVKAKTDLAVSIHSGLVDEKTARSLKLAGVDQTLIDVIGDDQTFKTIYHVPFGTSRIIDTLDALSASGLDIVPHIVCGIASGAIRGEWNAIEIISRYPIHQVVVVSLMKLSGSKGSNPVMPRAESVAEIICEAQLAMPEASISLGCARQRGNPAIELLAIEAGVDRLALPSDEAIDKARNDGLAICFQPTCCSVPPNPALAIQTE